MSRRDASVHVLRKIVLDLLLLSALIGCIFITNFLWEPFARGFFCGDESLMFPYKKDTVSSDVLRIVGLGLPMISIIICEWTLLRKEQDDEKCFGVRIPAWVRGAYCALASFGLGVCFMELTANVAKNTIGRPRPHFFNVCQPSVDCNSLEWRNRYIQSHEYHCTGDQKELFKDMRMSFLSGHSSWAAYTMVYLALYLEKRMVWRGTRVLRHTLQFSAIMLSWFTALSRVSDYKHHWSDVLAGYFMGLAGAIIMWTWGTDLIQKKEEHKPLSQHDITLTIQSNDTLS
ncbi:putative phosphatidate phosphatase [Aphomia sociella]